MRSLLVLQKKKLAGWNLKVKPGVKWEKDETESAEPRGTPEHRAGSSPQTCDLQTEQSRKVSARKGEATAQGWGERSGCVYSLVSWVKGDPLFSSGFSESQGTFAEAATWPGLLKTLGP